VGTTCQGVQAYGALTDVSSKFSEIDCWSHATSSISALSNLALNSSTQETIARVNRLIDLWPADDAFPAEGLETIRTNYKKLVSGLNDIKAQSEGDAKYTRPVMVHDK
jgi:SAGA-associated factor 29